ncbi:g399 [Coccomyxa viridis]|uniref:G399 protein n=1 Tax=Coccomyxa viridis TaxID=1274662 RepID=A0ABP1FFL3_9CHLO
MDDLYSNQEARLRFEAYSRLQASAVAFGESLAIPEIVAIGGQSDGKSTLLEAFLGFRFNVREVEMGTRRPLIVMMVHDPSAETPRCRLQEEDSEEYGPPIVPETAVAAAIKAMTEKHLAQTGGTVSAKPIVLRAEYAYCPNLTIIDTPGFILKARQGEGESTPDDILAMVKAQAAPSHRLILFLQQSSVEWASSLWMHVVQELDPEFKRTVVVASKFDNRLKEFGERWEVDRYLSAAGYLSANVRPFFVALPKERALCSSSEWRSQIQGVDRDVLSHLQHNIAGGFDQERFGGSIGFGNLKRYLEEELAKKYRDAAPATLALLQDRCAKLSAELALAESKLHAMQDVTSLRTAAMKHVGQLAGLFSSMLLDGAATPELVQQGYTTEEERSASGLSQWPGVQGLKDPPHAQLQLFGGAAFERCMSEFQTAVTSLSFPGVAQAHVANVVLAAGLRGQGGAAAAEQAARQVARAQAKALLLPLLDTAIARLAAVLRRTWQLAVDHAVPEDNPMRPYVAFNAELRAAFQGCVARMEEHCAALVRHELEVATSAFARRISLATLSLEDDADEDENVPPGQHTQVLPDRAGHSIPPPTQILHERDVHASQMTVPETPSPDVLAAKRNRRHNLARQATVGAMKAKSKQHGEGQYSSVHRLAEAHFMHIREAVAQESAPATLKAAFLEPISRSLATDLSVHLFARTDQHFMSWFTSPGAVEVMHAKRDALARKAEGLIKCKEDFSELARCL